MKKHHFSKAFLMLLFSVLIFYGCRNEMDLVNNEPKVTENFHERFSYSYISTNNLKKRLKNEAIKNSFENNIRKQISSLNMKAQFSGNFIYEKSYDSIKKITTYSLPLVKFSDHTPYYLHHIISVDNQGTEKSGFLKLIPSLPFSEKKYNEGKFTGKIQILDDHFKIFSQSTFIDGIKQEKPNRSSSNARFDCWNTVSLVLHTYTNGGNHSPGESCGVDAGGNQLVNNAYWEITTTLVCGNVDEYLAAPPPSYFGYSGGSSSLGNNLYELLNHPNFLYANFLTQDDKIDLLNLVGIWSINNNIDTVSISHINNVLNLFVSNPQLFSKFDELQDLLNNNRYYLSGEGRYS